MAGSRLRGRIIDDPELSDELANMRAAVAPDSPLTGR
jgi:hypothetical protein